MTTQTKEKEYKTMEELLEGSEIKEAPLNEGSIAEGTVLDMRGGKIWVDLGGRMCGIIYRKESGGRGSTANLKVGDKITAYIMGEETDEGFLILSLKKAGKERTWAELDHFLQNDEEIDVTISDANKGGLLVNYQEVSGFIPVSQLSADYYPRVEGGDKDEIQMRLSKLIAKKMRVKVLDVDKENEKLIFSQKAVKSREHEKFIDTLKVGQKLSGEVTGVVDFGVFVKIGPLEGLVHISEVAWDRVDDIKKYVKVGQKIDVMVIDIDNDKVSLSIKRLKEDPWKNMVSGFKEEQEIEGKVIRVMPFGAFVQVENKKGEKVDGLVHISELTEEHVTNPADIVKEGKSYKFRIISIEPENRRLGLSLKEAGKESLSSDDQPETKGKKEKDNEKALIEEKEQKETKKEKTKTKVKKKETKKAKDSASKESAAKKENNEDDASASSEQGVETDVEQKEQE